MPDGLIENEGRVLRVNGQRFHAVWLRHNALDGQRPTALADLPANITLSAAKIAGEHVNLTFAPEGKTLQFPLKWLKDHAYDTPQERSEGHMPAGSTPWGAGLQAAIPTAPLEALKAYEATKYSWLDAIRSYGWAKATELADSKGEIGALFTPTDAPHPLSSHAPDNSLHILTGQETDQDTTIRLTDGFACALRLKSQDPEGFAALAHQSARFVFQDSAQRPFPARGPIISLLPEGTFDAIRFAPEALATLTDIPFMQMETYYRAYRCFWELTQSSEMQISLTLARGEALVLDTSRVLHNSKDPLKTAFADKNGLLATLTALEATP